MKNRKEIKGVIFDFNGTLFQDGDINRITWRDFIKKTFGVDVTDEDFVKYIYGIPNRDTLEHYAGRALTREEVFEYAENGKEQTYRDYITDHPERQVLTFGAEDLLDELKAKGVPMTIATASAKGNLDFFFDVFGLNRWFDYEKVIYDDDTYKGKPAPDIYLKASDVLGLAPNECMVLEDAHSGVESARRAGVGLIVGVDPDGESGLEKLDFVDHVIRDFTEFDTAWLA